MSRMKWRKIKVQFLLLDEHPGRYYCRLYADGKQHWKSLETDVFSVAKARLAKHMKDFRSAVKTDHHERRFIPITPAMATLLADMRDHPRYFRGERQAYVLKVRECQKALDKACKTVGVKRLTHHDLRHLLCTRAIQSGIDR